MSLWIADLDIRANDPHAKGTASRADPASVISNKNRRGIRMTGSQ
jgi:hypothetical protein